MIFPISLKPSKVGPEWIGHPVLPVAQQVAEAISIYSISTATALIQSIQSTCLHVRVMKRTNRSTVAARDEERAANDRMNQSNVELSMN